MRRHRDPSRLRARSRLGGSTAALLAGFELVGIQDHPYQRRFLDTWTLIAFVLAQTSRITVFPDVYGRLIGKRFAAKFFLDQVAKHGTHACNYLLTANLEMDPLDGFQLANWEKGFGDFESLFPCTQFSLTRAPRSGIDLDFHCGGRRFEATRTLEVPPQEMLPEDGLPRKD